MENGKILVKFIRKGHGRLVGAVVASGKNQIGWSICNKVDRLDGKFDKQKAISIALGRSLRVKNPKKALDTEVAISARKEYRKMMERAKKFNSF